MIVKDKTKQYITMNTFKANESDIFLTCRIEGEILDYVSIAKLMIAEESGNTYRMHVDIYYNDFDKTYGISWASYGAISLNDTIAFMELLKEAKEIVHSVQIDKHFFDEYLIKNYSIINNK